MSNAKARPAARLAAVQALYQHAMEGTPLASLLDEFHRHRLGAEIEGNQYAEAEVAFFDAIVQGVIARYEEIDGLLAATAAVHGLTLATLPSGVTTRLPTLGSVFAASTARYSGEWPPLPAR